MDGISRRESRIPRGPPASTGSAASKAMPLEERQNTMPLDRKRKAAPLPTVPEAKRRGTRTTAGPSTSSAATAAAANAAKKPAAAAAPAAAEETFEDIAARTGLGVNDILERKLAFKKGTMPAKKLEEMGPVIKELKAVGWHLLSCQERAEMDAQQWKGHAVELEAKAAKDASEWAAKQDSIEKQMQEIKDMLSQAESNNGRLQEELGAAEKFLAEKEARAAELQSAFEAKEEEVKQLTKQVEERDVKIREMEEVVRQSQKYSTTLQSYNTSLQNDINTEKVAREELSRARNVLQGQVAELGGMARSLEQLLKQEQDQVSKLREERENAGRDAAVLRTDLDATRSDRDRMAAEGAALKAELNKIRAAGGKSAETIEALSNNHATLEAQLDSQRRLMESMRGELASQREGRAMAESLNASRAAQLEEMKAQISTLQASLADAERRVFESELIRRKLHNTIQELKGNIRVFCRVRPPSQQEMTDAQGTEVLATDFPASGDLLGRGLDITVPGSLTGQAPQRHSFAFDKVFGPTAGQEAIFSEISELVQSALDGHKVCIFAYGQTGSGKTYTMLGDESNRGIIPRAMTQVFDSSKALATQGWAFTMQASMLEIYNEEYKDLLAKKKLADGKSHKVVHDAAGGTTVSDLTLVDVTRPEAVEDLLAQAMQKRSVSCTLMNEQSSRSHMVFTLRIEGTNASSQLKVSGLLNLIDLAGSERVKESGATGVRMKEAQNINRSLSALGDVIMALANKADHIPYRNSKLTWLLQPSLGGDAKTLMFVNISPARDYAPESLCSLRFAAKVNACEIGTARRNVKPT